MTSPFDRNRYFFVAPVPFSDGGRNALVLSVHGMRKLADALEATEPDLAVRLRETADVREREAHARIAAREAKR